LKVDIVIAGFQKAGTTSLKNYLGQHPEIATHFQKEMTFFSVSNEFDLGFEKAIERYYSEYNRQPHLLAKHATLIRNIENIKRLYQHNPHCKIIVTLRNPVERAYSSYLMEITNGSLREAFDDVLKEGFHNYEKGESDWRYNVFIKLGEYVAYLDQLTSIFPKEQVLVLPIEKFYSNAYETMEEMLQFLDLEGNSKINLEKEHNTFKVQRSPLLTSLIKNVIGKDKPIRRVAERFFSGKTLGKWGEFLRSTNKKVAKKEPMSNWAAEKLQAHYAPYNDLLRDKYGIHY
jgi:hypothetical protein